MGIWGAVPGALAAPFFRGPLGCLRLLCSSRRSSSTGVNTTPHFLPQILFRGGDLVKRALLGGWLVCFARASRRKTFFFSPCKGITGGFPISEDSLHTGGAWVGSRAHRESHRVPAPSESHSGKVSGRPPSPPAPRHPAGVPTLTPLHLFSVAACIAYSRALLHYCQTFFFFLMIFLIDVFLCFR